MLLFLGIYPHFYQNQAKMIIDCHYVYNYESIPYFMSSLSYFLPQQGTCGILYLHQTDSTSDRMV